MAGEPNTYGDDDVDEIVADRDRRIAELEDELANSRRMIGYIVTECGGSVVVTYHTIAQARNFNLSRQETPSGGFLIVAKPAT